MWTGPLLPGHALLTEGLQPLVNAWQVLAHFAPNGAVWNFLGIIVLHGQAYDARVAVARDKLRLKAHHDGLGSCAMLET